MAQKASKPKGSPGKDSPILFFLVAVVGAGAWLATHGRALIERATGGRLGAAGSRRLLEHQALELGAVVVGILLLVEGSGLLTRYVWRRRRARGMRVEEIILGPNDTGEPKEIMRALDTIHGQISTRYGSKFVGQDFFTFEIVRKDDGSIHFLLAAACERYDWLSLVESTLRAKYTNIRFGPWQDEHHAWTRRQQITLRKHWRYATEKVDDYQNSLIETIVQNLDEAKGPCHLQYHLTPIPSEPMHQRLRSHLRGTERGHKAVQMMDPASPGVGLTDAEPIKDSLELYGKSSFRVEIRLAGMDWETVQAVYGAFKEASGENSFRASTVIAGGSLWNIWFYERLASPVLFRPSILFSYPLATLIHLPTNRLRVGSLNRYYVRRAPVTLQVPRATSRDVALVADHETGALCTIPEANRKAGVMIVGVQGSGKTTDALSIYRSDVRYRDAEGRPKPVVLIGIGKDTEYRALGMVPPDRKVIYYAPGDPNCDLTLHPIYAAPSTAVMMDNVLATMSDVFGEAAIQWRSKEFLTEAFSAVREVLGYQGDFIAAYRILTDKEFRDRVIEHVQDEHSKDYWQKTFRNAMAANPRFLEEGLAAPRNKLDEMLRNPLVRKTLSASAGRRILDFRAIIRDRSVLVVNLDKAKLGEAGARLLGIFVVMSLWYALQEQNEIEEKDRVQVSLILDEAQNYVSSGFLNMLSEGRAYGLQVTLAIRFLGEIENTRVIQGMHMLLRNVILHQFQDVGEARYYMEQFMRTWANAVQVTAESQDAISLGVDDLIRLPEFTGVCRWMVGREVAAAFFADTINWEEFYRDDWRRFHLSRQETYAQTGDGEMRWRRPEAAREDLVALDMDGTSRSEEAPGQELVLDLSGAVSAMPAAADVDDVVFDMEPPGPATLPPALAPGEWGEAGDGVATSVEGDEDVRSGPDVLSLVLGEALTEKLMETAKDELTGLFGQKVWLKALESFEGEHHAVAFLDVDGLKETNDGPGGHEAGDQLIAKVGKALSAVTRRSDLACRCGGDEFGVILRGVDTMEARAWTRRLRMALAEAGVTVSVGIAVQDAGEALSDTARRADSTMYAEKRMHHAAGASEETVEVGIGEHGTVEAVQDPASLPGAHAAADGPSGPVGDRAAGKRGPVTQQAALGRAASSGTRSGTGPAATASHAPATRPAGSQGARRGELTGPEGWGEYDPRHLFCQKHGVTAARLLQSAATLGATDREVVQTAEWALHKGIESEGAVRRFMAVLRLKVEDRLLAPAALHHRIAINDLRHMLEREELSAQTLSEVFAEHKNLDLAALIAACKRDEVRA